MRYNGLTSVIRQVLDDGEWHSVLDIVTQVRYLIPPEVATRAYLQQRYRKLDDYGMAWKLNKGRRHVVIKVISSLLHQRIPPEVEVRREEGHRTIIAVRKL